MNTKISEAENKIPNTGNLVTINVLYTKNNEVENKIPNILLLYYYYFAARLKQPNLVTKTDFDNKLTSYNRRITSNKTKNLEVQKKLNSLITNDYSFFLDRIYFTVMMDLKTRLFIKQHLIR